MILKLTIPLNEKASSLALPLADFDTHPKKSPLSTQCATPPHHALHATSTLYTKPIETSDLGLVPSLASGTCLLCRVSSAYRFLASTSRIEYQGIGAEVKVRSLYCCTSVLLSKSQQRPSFYGDDARH